MKKLLCAALSLVLCLALTVCACAETAESDLAYVQEKGSLAVGITNFAPMDYQDEAGEWIGFDADMAKLFAESLGVDVEFIEINWDYKVEELNAKNIDVVWNGMTLLEDVMNAMGTSRPARPAPARSGNTARRCSWRSSRPPTASCRSRRRRCSWR